MKLSSDPRTLMQSLQSSPFSPVVRERDSVTRLSWVILLIVAFSLLLWEQAGNAGVLRRVATWVAQPSIRVTTQLHHWQGEVGRWWQFTVRGAQHLAQLENEVRRWQVDQTRLHELEAENTALRAELHFPLSPDERVAPWYGSEQQWFVGLGCEEGVEVGSLVTADGVFVGTVEKTFASYSEVRTWDDPNWRLAVKVGTESAYGVFSFGRSIPEVEEVAIQYKDAVGASVRTAGYADIPPNYLIGTVQEVREEAGFGTVRMVVDPAVDLYSIQVVRVEVREEDTCSL